MVFSTLTRSRRLAIGVTFIVLSSMLFFYEARRGSGSWLPSYLPQHLDLGVHKPAPPPTADTSSPAPPVIDTAPLPPPVSAPPASNRPAGAAPKYAFATLLSGNDADHSYYPANATIRDDDYATDGYFIGTRHLIYSLAHHPQTKSAKPIPFIVLAMPSVSAGKRARLQADGAIVIEVVPIPLPKWIQPGSPRWKDMATKLRLVELEEYDKICYIDADHLVTAPLDGVFEDPATNTVITLEQPDQVVADEPALPLDYMFAGRPDMFRADHDIPPPEANYLNAGFFVLRPSRALFEYYLGLMQIEGRFGGGFVEQDMFNYAHRRAGNMPWKSLQWQWNVNFPGVRDYKAGVKSFHAKWWDRSKNNDPDLRDIWWDTWESFRKFYRDKETWPIRRRTVGRL
jgi:alpha-N-acetylglucosamine transferase